MSLSTLNNGDSGLDARTKINAAIAAVNGNASLAAANIFTVNGAADAPAMALTGTVFTGGTSTSTKPLCLIEPSGTTSTGWNADGTLFGINMPNTFAGDGISIQKEGVKQLSITKDGRLSWGFQGSYNRQPVLYVDGPYAQVEWIQGGDGNISTQAPFLAGPYLSCVDPSNGYGGRFQKESDHNLGILQNYFIGSPLEVRIYGVFTDASNYERLSFITASSDYTITPEAAGTGALQNLRLGKSGMSLYSDADQFITAGDITGGGNIIATGGFESSGSPGVTGTATAANTLTIVGGIVTNIA